MSARISAVRAPRGPVCAFVFALLLNAQSDLPKDVLQLAQLKREVGASLAALPNYTCVETIERYGRVSESGSFWADPQTLEFTDIEFPGHHARFIGEMLGIQPVEGLSLVSSSSKVETRDAGMTGTLTMTRVETEIPMPVPGVSTFFMEGPHFRLAKGVAMTWRTSQLVR